MARIERKHQKVFAKDAVNNGVFGSAADSTKVNSSDIDTIQSKPAYDTGWLTAVIGDKKFPALEEFQALHYMTTSQIAYIFQEGIPAYSASQTYYTNSIVKKAGTYELYGSKINNNLGNPLPDAVDDDNWEFLQDLSSSFSNATESARGIAEIATAQETKTGTDDEKFITPLKLNPYKPQTGDGKDHWTSNLQDGWVWADGKTIGNASSNATNRANADCEDLFKALWADYPYTGTTANSSNGQLQVFNSAGVAVARGASADADWSANRSIAIIDKRDRVSAGLGNMGGSPAGRLSGQTGGVNGNKLGASGGQELQTLSESQIPSHNHNNGVADSGTLALVYDTTTQDIPGNAGAGITAGGTATVQGKTGMTGGGEGHNNVQPSIVCNYIIKL